MSSASAPAPASASASASASAPASSSSSSEEGHPIKKLTMKTADGECFEVEESIAMEFVAIKNFLDESTATVVPLPNVMAKSLSLIVEYCRKQLEFRGIANNEVVRKAKEEYNKKYLQEINNEELKELILAVNYLEIKYLLDVLNEAAAKRIANKSVEYVRKFFGIESDFTPEEEARLRQENHWAFEDVDPDNDDDV